MLNAKWFVFVKDTTVVYHMEVVYKWCSAPVNMRFPVDIRGFCILQFL